MQCQLSRNDRKGPGKKTRADDGVERKCSWRSKKSAARAWVRKRMLKKHPERELSRGAKGGQDAPNKDAEEGQEKQGQAEFVCRWCHRVLESKTWVNRHQYEPTSIIKSEGSNELEQPVTVARPICSKECRYRWLLRHVLTKHPRHNEPLRPQSRAKDKRKEMRTENQSQGERSGPLDPAGDGNGDAKRPWKRPQAGRCTEETEGRGYVFNRCVSAYKQWYSLVWYTPAHHKNDTTAKRKLTVGTVAPTPLLQRSLQCPYCPTKRALKQCLTMRRQAKHGQPGRQDKHDSLKVENQDSVAQLLGRPSLRELTKKHELESLKEGELFFSAQLASFPQELFKLESPSAHTPGEPELRPARAVKGHHSPTELDTTYPPSAAAKRIGACAARGVRQRDREADSPSKEICFNAPPDEARMGSGLHLTSPAGLQSRGSSRKSSETPPD
ncbi:hypothetical protein, conserved [Trypanosoma vivax Y486]|uniref:Uncharacterized protein n=1 Tax=Trypanosoma vivax (strain Y486) TaxID=1055687 RepID=F9WMS4_TRYVY|nr:hypothetical protein, conserved [Trypanosoma vivax Y486]|eukprot:CCD18836.1 hypothetical protein, conserved [Trypanosoma vivax Y486]